MLILMALPAYLDIVRRELVKAGPRNSYNSVRVVDQIGTALIMPDSAFPRARGLDDESFHRLLTKYAANPLGRIGDDDAKDLGVAPDLLRIQFLRAQRQWLRFAHCDIDRAPKIKLKYLPEDKPSVDKFMETVLDSIPGSTLKSGLIDTFSVLFHKWLLRSLDFANQPVGETIEAKLQDTLQRADILHGYSTKSIEQFATRHNFLVSQLESFTANLDSCFQLETAAEQYKAMEPLIDSASFIFRSLIAMKAIDPQVPVLASARKIMNTVWQNLGQILSSLENSKLEKLTTKASLINAAQFIILSSKILDHGFKQLRSNLASWHKQTQESYTRAIAACRSC